MTLFTGIFLFLYPLFFRNIKLENIIVTFEKVIKIADFGLARVAKNDYELGETRIGTPGKKFL